MLALSATPVAAVAPASAEYRLSIHGGANETIRLRATHVPQGWVVSFCTGRICEPYRLDERLPASGRAAVDVRVFPRAPERAPLRAFVITSADGARLRITTP